MSQSPSEPSPAKPKKLPARPSLDHLQNQAHDLQRQSHQPGQTPLTLSQCYHQLAQSYGFASWPRLKAHIEFLNQPELLALLDAIKKDTTSEIIALLKTHPHLLAVRTPPNGYSLFHHACDASPATLTAILDAGLPINTQLPTGETVLHFSSTYPETHRVTLLLSKGADPTLHAGEPPQGGTPLVHALFHGCTVNAQLLSTTALTPLNLRTAAGLGRLDLLEKLWPQNQPLTPQASADLAWHRPHDEFPQCPLRNDPDHTAADALMFAAMNDQAAAIHWLLAKGSSPNPRPYWGTTPLHWAAFLGKRAAVDALLQHGTDVDIRDDLFNGFPWGWASHAKHPEIERLLISKSKKLDLFQACNFGPGIDRVREILDKDPQAINRRQPTPPSCGRHQQGTALHEAVDWYKPDVVLLLLDRGADVNAKTAAGLTPLAIALERKNQPAAALLRSRGGTL